MRKRTAVVARLLPLSVLAARDELTMQLLQDPAGTAAANASTSRWRGRSSNGMVSRVHQLATPSHS